MRPWTTLEIEALRYLGPRLGGPETAAALGRSYGSVKMQAHSFHVRLCRPTSLETGTKPLSSDALVKRIKRLAVAPLCPACAKRPVSVSKTGLCAPCHHATRLAISEEEIASLEAKRVRCASRAKLYRLRQADEIAPDEIGDAGETMVAEDASDLGEATCTR